MLPVAREGTVAVSCGCFAGIGLVGAHASALSHGDLVSAGCSGAINCHVCGIGTNARTNDGKPPRRRRVGWRRPSNSHLGS